MNSSKIFGLLYVVLLLSAVNAKEKGDGWLESVPDCWGWYVAGGVVAVVAAPLALPAIGFGAGGIAAGSIAASAMSTAATTGVGGAAVAVMQSAGAAGLGVATKAAVGVAGAYVAGKLAPCGEDNISEKCRKEN